MRNIQHFGKLLILISLFCTLSACGYHVRTKADLPAYINRMYFTSVMPYGDVTTALQKQLADDGITLLSDSTNAPCTLRIVDEKPNQVVTGVSSAQNSEISSVTYSYAATYTLLDYRGEPIIPLTTVIAQQVVTVSSSQLLGSQNEQIALQKDLVRQIINQMMNQIILSSRHRHKS